MVAAGKANTRLLRKVAEVYDWLDSQIHKNSALAGVCDVCGKCCDFKGFDHQLFITTPEMIYFAAKVGTENLRPMTTGRGSIRSQQDVRIMLTINARFISFVLPAVESFVVRAMRTFRAD